MSNLNIKEKDSKYIASTYKRNDLLITKGKGASCFDENGKKYIDFTSGIGVNSLGFSNDLWVDAVVEQLKKIQHMSNLYYTEPQAKLAEKLVEKTNMSKVFFTNSGAEANECMIKVARKYGNQNSDNNKNTIITLVNSFHGRTIATITATGQEHYHNNFFPFAAGFKYCKAGDLEELEGLIDENVCGIMLEIVQGEGGVLNLKEDYLKAVEKLCQEKDILLMIDEVQTGIGRTGSLFAYEQFDLKPDLVSLAKGIGAGLPLGGCLMGEKVKDVLTYGDHGTTFGGNPVACAGALVVLEHMDETFLKQVKEKGDFIKNSLKEMEIVEEVSGLGMMIGFKVKDMKASDVVSKAMEKGLLLLTAKDKVRLLPPLTISMEELKEGLDIVKDIAKA